MTRRGLEGRVEQLNKALGRPATGWRVVNGKSIANVGYLQLNCYAPGDGWTRYTLVEIVNEQGGETARSRCGTAGEMDYILDALFRALVWREFDTPKEHEDGDENRRLNAARGLAV